MESFYRNISPRPSSWESSSNPEDPRESFYPSEKISSYYYGKESLLGFILGVWGHTSSSLSMWS